MKFPCPACENATRAIKPETLQSLLTTEALESRVDLAGYRFCPNSECDLVYSHPDRDEKLLADSVAVPVFQKSDDSGRFVCYCFEYRVSEIYSEVKSKGSSDVVASITAKCRNGEDHCSLKNPQGSCCLGNVRAVVKEAQSVLNVIGPVLDVEDAPCCCSSVGSEEKASVSET